MRALALEANRRRPAQGRAARGRCEEQLSGAKNQKLIATNAGYWLPYVDLAAANGWLGRQAEAKAATAGLLKLMPIFTVQQLARIKWSDDPQFQPEYQRITEGLRKAGAPEGDVKRN